VARESESESEKRGGNGRGAGGELDIGAGLEVEVEVDKRSGSVAQRSHVTVHHHKSKSARKQGASVPRSSSAHCCAVLVCYILYAQTVWDCLSLRGCPIQVCAVLRPLLAAGPQLAAPNSRLVRAGPSACSDGRPFVASAAARFQQTSRSRPEATPRAPFTLGLHTMGPLCSHQERLLRLLWPLLVAKCSKCWKLEELSCSCRRRQTSAN